MSKTIARTHQRHVSLDSISDGGVSDTEPDMPGTVNREVRHILTSDKKSRRTWPGPVAESPLLPVGAQSTTFMGPAVGKSPGSVCELLTHVHDYLQMDLTCLTINFKLANQSLVSIVQRASDCSRVMSMIRKGGASPELSEKAVVRAKEIGKEFTELQIWKQAVARKILLNKAIGHSIAHSISITTLFFGPRKQSSSSDAQGTLKTNFKNASIEFANRSDKALSAIRPKFQKAQRCVDEMQWHERRLRRNLAKLRRARARITRRQNLLTSIAEIPPS